MQELLEIQKIGLAASGPPDPGILSLLQDPPEVKWGKVA